MDDTPYQAGTRAFGCPSPKGTDKPVLSSLFSVYDCVDGDGYNNFGKWVEAAAKQA